jgi:hypothetical protein
MPYATDADAPPDVRDRFTGHCLTVWRQTWNDTFDRHGDEGRAWATAEIAGQACTDGSQKMMMTTPTDAAGMRKHMVAAEPNGHAAAPDPLADMPMADMTSKHDAMHKAGAGAHHTHAFEPTKSVHFVKDAPDLIEGLAIPFGTASKKDLDGEYFDARTDLCLPWFGETGRPILYGHGLNPAVKAEVVGRQTSFDQRDDGVWIQVELDKSSRYRERVGKLIEQGALSFSSGSMPHLVQTSKDGHIDRWPWVENSFTPTPAHPRAVVYAVKSADMAEHYAAANIDIPDPLAAALKALDEWAVIRDGGLPDGLPIAEESDRLLDALKAFVERTQGLADLRAKSGRTFSAANRERLSSHVDAIVSAMGSMGTTLADMRALLSATDPEATKRSAMAELARFDFLTATLP